MKLIKVRVNKTVEYEVSVPVQDEHNYEQVFDYLQTIDWDREIGISPRNNQTHPCLLYTSPSPRDGLLSRMPSSA